MKHGLDQDIVMITEGKASLEDAMTGVIGPNRCYIVLQQDAPESGVVSREAVWKRHQGHWKIYRTPLLMQVHSIHGQASHG